MTEQGRPPREPGYPGRPGRPRGAREPRRTGWQALDAFDSTDNESDLPPWAVPGGIVPNQAPRRQARRPPQRPADDPAWPGDRAFGDPAMARPGTAAPGHTQPRPSQPGAGQPRPPQPRPAQPRPAQPRPAQPRPAQPRPAQAPPAPGWPDPYGDLPEYDEPPGYRRPPGYDEPREYPSRRRQRPGPDQARGYDQRGSDEYGDDARQRGGPGADETGDGQSMQRRLRRPGRTRAAAARRRRSKRRLLTWGGVAAAIVVLVGGGLYLTRSQPKKGLYVSTLQRGEFRGVPSACKVLSAATLHQVMGGTPLVQPVTGVAGQSECTYTVDVKPAFRILQIQEQAYQPSVAVPTGNGSATANAVWNFGWTKDQLAKPPKHAVWPAAKFAPVSGLGRQAVSAFQVSRGRVATDRVTVLVRYRNVLIQVSAQAQESGGFGPVPVADLRSAALTAARGAFAAVQHQPTA